MNEAKAREILGKMISNHNVLISKEGQGYCYWCRTDRCDTVELDGHYTTDELEAIAWWMRNKGE